MLLADLTATAERVRALSARGAKVQALAELLRRATPDEVPAVVAYLSGDLLQRQIGVGWAALRDLPAPAAEPTLTVDEVARRARRHRRTAGAGSQAERRRQLEALFGRATAAEQSFLGALLVGELRQGAQAGVMTDAVAKAAGLPLAAVRRALLLRGDLPAVARIALDAGRGGARRCRPRGRRAAAADAGRHGARRHDGAGEGRRPGGGGVEARRHPRPGAPRRRRRGRLHPQPRRHHGRVPEIVEVVRSLPAHALVLDGEAILLRADGRPEPFQVTASRTAAARRMGRRGS